MSDLAIRVEGLSKEYLIGRKQETYKTLRDSLSEALLSPFRRASKLLRGQATGAAELDEVIWALKDISFELKRGEVIGIIGRNGAGKSTLLKILSRITEPSKGFAEIHGRVGSLLEVGTGFHAELTGRENIYLNGAILGMRRQEIERKFDEIVAFSEVEKFIDTPVKHYSSGMYLRLAFAVAAHLDPEILIVDEVLAVGDMAFQNKCLGKMQDVAGHGRTVLFVSHNIWAIQSLCTRCLVLEKGGQEFDGRVEQAVAIYARRFKSFSQTDLATRTDRVGHGEARFTSIDLEDPNGMRISAVPMGAPLRICLKFRCSRRFEQPQIGIALTTTTGQRLFRLNTVDQAVRLPSVSGDALVICEIPSVPLLPGMYLISVSIADVSSELEDFVDSATSIEVLPADVFGTGHIPVGGGDIIFVPSHWELSPTTGMASAFCDSRPEA